MDIRVIVFTPGNGMVQIPSNTGAYQHASVDEAKKATAAYIGGQNKATFASGYDALIIDLDNRKLASWAGQPKPTLTWSDSPNTPNS